MGSYRVTLLQHSCVDFIPYGYWYLSKASTNRQYWYCPYVSWSSTILYGSYEFSLQLEKVNAKLQHYKKKVKKRTSRERSAECQTDWSCKYETYLLQGLLERYRTVG